MVLIEQHLKKYPLMTLQDIVKLCYQGILGPSHMFVDEKRAMEFLQRELDEAAANGDSCETVVEEISDKYVRVHIVPYFEKHHNLEGLAKAFALSAKEVGDETQFVAAIEALMDDQNRAVLQKYLQEGHPAVHHSQQFAKAYKPHYRVVAKKYLGIAMEEV